MKKDEQHIPNTAVTLRDIWRMLAAMPVKRRVLCLALLPVILAVILIEHAAELIYYNEPTRKLDDFIDRLCAGDGYNR